MRIVFFGTPEFAVPTLERLLAGPHSVELVISQPDRRKGRGRQTSPSPVSEVAERHGIPLLRPESVNSEEVLTAFRASEADLGVVVAFGQFIGKPLREGSKLGYLIIKRSGLSNDSASSFAPTPNLFACPFFVEISCRASSKLLSFPN